MTEFADLLKLEIKNKTIQSGTVRISWVVSPLLLDALRERDRERSWRATPHITNILIILRKPIEGRTNLLVNEGQLLSKEERFLFPLSDGEAWIQLKRPGPLQIKAVLLTTNDQSDLNLLQSRHSDVYDYSLFDENDQLYTKGCALKDVFGDSRFNRWCDRFLASISVFFLPHVLILFLATWYIEESAGFFLSFLALLIILETERQLWKDTFSRWRKKRAAELKKRKDEQGFVKLEEPKTLGEVIEATKRDDSERAFLTTPSDQRTTQMRKHFPLSRRVYLRYEELKAAVCRPFAD